MSKDVINKVLEIVIFLNGEQNFDLDKFNKHNNTELTQEDVQKMVDSNKDLIEICLLGLQTRRDNWRTKILEEVHKCYPHERLEGEPEYDCFLDFLDMYCRDEAILYSYLQHRVVGANWLLEKVYNNVLGMSDSEFTINEFLEELEDRILWVDSKRRDLLYDMVDEDCEEDSDEVPTVPFIPTAKGSRRPVIPQVPKCPSGRPPIIPGNKLFNGGRPTVPKFKRGDE